MSRAEYGRAWQEYKERKVGAKTTSPCFLKRALHDAWVVIPLIGLCALFALQIVLKMRSAEVPVSMWDAILGSSVFNAAVVAVLVMMLFDRARSIWALSKIRLSLLNLSQNLGVLRGEAQNIVNVRDDRAFCERVRLFLMSGIGPTRTGIEVIDGLIQRVHSLGQYHEEAAVIHSFWRMIDDLRQELWSFSFLETGKIDLVLGDLLEDRKALYAKTMGTALEDIPEHLRAKLWRISYLCGKCPEQVCENIARGIEKGNLGKWPKGPYVILTGPHRRGERRFILRDILVVPWQKRSEEAALADREIWVFECSLFDLNAEHSDPMRAQDMILEKIIDLRDQLLSKPDEELTLDERSKKGLLNDLVKEVVEGARQADPKKPD